jgi:phosphate transport system substrate-binding protein
MTGWRRRIWGRHAIGTVAALTLVSAAGMFGMVLTNATPASATEPQLNSTGSSFAGVAISQWQGQFNEEFGGGINFTVSNSVTGMNSFCNKTVDFGATDISYATQQSTCTTNQVPYPFQYMPDVAGGLSFEYNLTGQNGQQVTNLVLNAATLVGIFTGDINNWDDSTIAALNPGIRLPNEQITAYYRSDPCGENYLLGDYFLHTDPGPFTAFQQVAQVTPTGSPSATWASFGGGVPPGKQSLVGVNGSDAASQGPVHQQGGITFVETAYAKNVGLPVASVVNQAGVPTQPSSYNVAVALTGAILYSDLTQNLGGVYTNPNPSTYPISAYSYFIAQCVPAAAAAQNFACDSQGNVTMGTAQGAELSQFIAYVACLGQSKMAELGYSPIPPNLVLDDFQAAGRLPGGTEPPNPTPQNCPNPYITGQLTSPGGPQGGGGVNPGSDLGTGTTTAAASSGTSAAGGAQVSAASGPGVSGPGSSAASAAGGKKVVVKKVAVNPLTDPAKAYPRQDALTAAATRGLAGLSLAEVAWWSVVFLVLLIAVPVGVWYWQRRRRPHEATETGTS